MAEQTDEILSQIAAGTSDENEVDFVEADDVRREVRKDMENRSSLNRFAGECSIQPSHLSDFFNHGKKLGRDKMLAVLINLQYGLEKTQTVLRRLGYQELYVRSRRDYQIAVGIREGKSLDEIDRILCERKLEPLIRQEKP